jgi:hypothetical protein
LRRWDDAKRIGVAYIDILVDIDGVEAVLGALAMKVAKVAAAAPRAAATATARRRRHRIAMACQILAALLPPSENTKNS